MRRIEILTGFAGTAVSPTFSAVSSQTGQDFNTTHKMKCDFLKKFEKTKWGQKSPYADTASATGG